jgi:hypothetical protein
MRGCTPQLVKLNGLQWAIESALRDALMYHMVGGNAGLSGTHHSYKSYRNTGKYFVCWSIHPPAVKIHWFLRKRSTMHNAKICFQMYCSTNETMSNAHWLVGGAITIAVDHGLPRRQRRPRVTCECSQAARKPPQTVNFKLFSRWFGCIIKGTDIRHGRVGNAWGYRCVRMGRMGKVCRESHGCSARGSA